MSSAIADTSFVIAVAVATDQHHKNCVAIYKQYTTIYLPQTTLAETAYLITRESGNRATALFLRSLSLSRFSVVALTLSDVERTATLLDMYYDARLDFVDATIVAVAERLTITRVLTLDRRDFSIVRPQHVNYLEILP